jgi:hypothetical protein
MAAASQEWAEALVAEPAAVLEAAGAAANQEGAPESVVAMVAEVATVAEVAMARAVDPAVVTALEAVLVAVNQKVAQDSKLQAS